MCPSTTIGIDTTAQTNIPINIIRLKSLQTRPKHPIETPTLKNTANGTAPTTSTQITPRKTATPFCPPPDRLLVNT